MLFDRRTKKENTLLFWYSSLFMLVMPVLLTLALKYLMPQAYENLLLDKSYFILSSVLNCGATTLAYIGPMVAKNARYCILFNFMITFTPLLIFAVHNNTAQLTVATKAYESTMATHNYLLAVLLVILAQVVFSKIEIISNKEKETS
ncbi:MAG: hypothetical protein Q4A96_02440 [Candidatus Saccharibacteria bacterium]|nr:hypothetical protein [Candidatus Saccharibacteria bacterium]